MYKSLFLKMVFSLLPRNSFTIECVLTPEAFHEKLDRAFNTTTSSFNQDLQKLPAQFSGYTHSGDRFEIKKFFPGRNDLFGSSVYGTGQIVNQEPYLQVHIRYVNKNTGAEVLTLISGFMVLLTLIACVVNFYYQQAEWLFRVTGYLAGGIPLLVLLLIRYFMNLQVKLLHGAVVHALE